MKCVTIRFRWYRVSCQGPNDVPIRIEDVAVPSLVPMSTFIAEGESSRSFYIQAIDAEDALERWKKGFPDK